MPLDHTSNPPKPLSGTNDEDPMFEDPEYKEWFSRIPTPKVVIPTVQKVMNWRPPPVDFPKLVGASSRNAHRTDNARSAPKQSGPPGLRNKRKRETPKTNEPRTAVKLREEHHNSEMEEDAKTMQKPQTLRGGNFYDQHLDKKLVARHVVYRRGLLRTFIDTARRYWNDLQEKGVPLTVEDIPSSTRLETDRLRWKSEVSEEGDIRMNYCLFPAQYCQPLASTFLFGFKKWGPPILDWRAFVERRKYAIADGGLYVTSHLEDLSAVPQGFKYVTESESLSADTLEALSKLARGRKVVAVWEFKHLTVGDKEVMDEIESMGRGTSQFAWKFCPLVLDGHTPSGDPGDEPKGNGGGDSGTGGEKTRGRGAGVRIEAKPTTRMETRSQTRMKTRMETRSQPRMETRSQTRAKLGTGGESGEGKGKEKGKMTGTGNEDEKGVKNEKTKGKGKGTENEKAMGQETGAILGSRAKAQTGGGDLRSKCPKHETRTAQMRRWQKMGLDAQNPPWKDALATLQRPPRPSSDEQVSSLPGSERPPSNLDGFEKNDQPGNPTDSAGKIPAAVASPQAGTSNSGGHLNPENGRNGLAKRTNAQHDENTLENDGLFAVDADGVVIRDRPPGDESSGVPARKKIKIQRKDANSQAIIQQAWAETVRNRCSVVVINSGKYELIGVRDRKSQTLYITDIFDPSKPVEGAGYGEIHVGIYICALLDAMDRIQLPQQPEPKGASSGVELSDPVVTDAAPDTNGDHGSPADPDVDMDDDEGSQNNGNGSSGPIQKRKTCDNCISSLDEASSRNLLLLSLRYDIYDSPIPAPFLRVGTQQPDFEEVLGESQQPDDISTSTFLTTEKSFNVILTEEKQPQSTGVVHIGQLCCADTPCIDRTCPCARIVAKIGFSSLDKQILLKEHETYTDLHRHGVKGIPRNIGIFSDLDRYGADEIQGPYALILSYVGPSLHGRAHTIPREAKLSLLSTLNAIHSQDIIHGDVEGKNLCMLNGEVSIIDFSHCWTSRDPGEKDHEFELLCSELDIDVQEAIAAIRPSEVQATSPVSPKSGTIEEPQAPDEHAIPLRRSANQPAPEDKLGPSADNAVPPRKTRNRKKQLAPEDQSQALVDAAREEPEIKQTTRVVTRSMTRAAEIAATMGGNETPVKNISLNTGKAGSPLPGKKTPKRPRSPRRKRSKPSKDILPLTNKASGATSARLRKLNRRTFLP